MATKETDTDPSTPVARAPKAPPAGPIMPARIVSVAPVGTSSARPPKAGTSTDPGVAPSHAHASDTDPDPRGAVPSTDPGLAPPSGPGNAPHRTPVVVPAARAGGPPRVPARVAAGKNDSIDSLLEGIAGEQPEKTKKTPQSRGEAAAAYQVEHKLLPGQPTPPPQPSVIVERPPQPPTIRIERAKIDAARAEFLASQQTAAPPPPSVRPVTRTGEATVVTPRKQGPRIVIALFAAILVVFAIFVAMRMWAVGLKKQAMATDPTASQLIIRPMPVPGASVSATATASSLPTPTASATATATAIATATATATTNATAPSTAKPAPAGSSNLGDFKHDFKH